MRCNDCGQTENRPSRRSDVCEPCIDLRGQLVTAMEEKRICMDEFREIQKVISDGRGEGANAIRRVLGLTAPEI